MNITILCVGKLKENYWQQAVKEYSKRLSGYVRLNVIEVADEKTPDNCSLAQEIQIKSKEGQRLASKMKLNSKGHELCIALDIAGEEMNSNQFSAFIEKTMLQGSSSIVFIIGGSLGLSDEVLNQADIRLSFSKMTLPHQLMRVVLLEQIYRGFKIMRGEPYHK